MQRDFQNLVGKIPHWNLLLCCFHLTVLYFFPLSGDACKRTSLVRVNEHMRIAVVVVVDRGSREKKESMSNAGGVV